MTEKIKLEIDVPRGAAVYTRWSCTVCGGSTEKVAVLVQTETPDGRIRACEMCLEAGDIDARLTRNAEELEREAAFIRGLIGRLIVPSYAEWRAAEDRFDEETMRVHGYSEAEIAAYRVEREQNDKEWRRRMAEERARIEAENEAEARRLGYPNLISMQAESTPDDTKH